MVCLSMIYNFVQSLLKDFLLKKNKRSNKMSLIKIFMKENVQMAEYNENSIRYLNDKWFDI